MSSNEPALLERAASLLATGRTAAARPMLAAVRHHAPGTPRLAELTALLELRDGNLAEAARQLDAGLEAFPDNGGMRKLRTELRLKNDDLAGALTDAADCVLHHPRDPAAAALLGVVLLEAGHLEDAASCLRQAVTDAPGNAAFARALAGALEALGDEEAAAATLDACIDRVPGDVGLRNTAILLAVRRRDFPAAIARAQAARQAGIADACLFGLLGHALSHLGQHDKAGDAYREALKLGPNDPYVRHLAAAAGMVADAGRAPDDYVRTVFDGYADRFEAHLIGLGYRVPGLLRAALLRHRPPGGASCSMLDLGCGTGLLAVALSDALPERMVGIDLSARMLQQARLKKLYTELHEAEIGAYLAATPDRFDIVAAADVLCYIGDLSASLAAIARVLPPGGLCLFSVEALDNPAQPIPAEPAQEWRLGPNGRFAHSAAHIRRCATQAGLTLREQSSENLRNEAGAAVTGYVIVLEKPA